MGHVKKRLWRAIARTICYSFALVEFKSFCCLGTKMFGEEEYQQMWQPLRNRLTITYQRLLNIVNGDNVSEEVRREVARLLYHQGYLETALALTLYNPNKDMEYHETKLGEIAERITAQEGACLQL